MNALLIGGTGVISADVTGLLLQRGWQVTLLNRGNRPPPQGAEGIVASMDDEAAVEAALADRSFDVVADFIAYTPAQVQRDMRLFSGRCGQYIFISSASAYQKPIAALPITESTPLANPYWEYSRLKIACEEALMAGYRAEGFPVTIVRPSHTYSKASLPVAIHGNHGSWPVLARMRAGRPVVIHGDGSSLWTLTHSRDFARGFVGLMGNPHALGHAVHITNDESLTWNQIYATWADALGVRLVAEYVPSHLIAQAGRVHGYDLEGALLGDKANSVLFDNTRLKTLVPGFAATTRFFEGARESVEHHLANPTLQTQDAAFDAFCDGLVAAMAAARGSLGL